jgi:hypothetical protein
MKLLEMKKPKKGRKRKLPKRGQRLAKSRKLSEMRDLSE